MARKPRKMMMFRFWLDQLNPRDQDAGAHLFVLREAADGRYTNTLRNGVRLIASLEQGRVDVLLELFPAIEAMLLSHRLRGDFDAPRALPMNNEDE